VVLTWDGIDESLFPFFSEKEKKSMDFGKVSLGIFPHVSGREEEI
jgi:hypothetical protein